MANNRLPIFGPLELRGNKVEGVADGTETGDAVTFDQLEGRLEKVTSFPTSPAPVTGDSVYLTTTVGNDDPGPYTYNGTDWVATGGGVSEVNFDRYAFHTSQTTAFYETDLLYDTRANATNDAAIQAITASTNRTFWRGANVVVAAGSFDPVQAAAGTLTALIEAETTDGNIQNSTGYFIISGLTIYNRDLFLQGDGAINNQSRIVFHDPAIGAVFITAVLPGNPLGTTAEARGNQVNRDGSSLTTVPGTSDIRFNPIKVQVINAIEDSGVRAYPISTATRTSDGSDTDNVLVDVTGFEVLTPTDDTDQLVQIGVLQDIQNISNRVESINFVEVQSTATLTFSQWEDSSAGTTISFSTAGERDTFVSLIDNSPANGTVDTEVTFSTTFDGEVSNVTIPVGATFSSVGAITLFFSGSTQQYAFPDGNIAIGSGTHVVTYPTIEQESGPVNGAIEFRGFDFQTLSDGRQIVTNQSALGTSTISAHTNISLTTNTNFSTPWSIIGNTTIVIFDALNEGDVATGLQTDLEKFLEAINVTNASGSAMSIANPITLTFEGNSINLTTTSTVTVNRSTNTLTISGSHNFQDDSNVINNPGNGDDIQITNTIPNAILEAGSNLQITTRGNIIEIASTEADIETGTTLPSGANHLDIFVLTAVNGNNTPGVYVWNVDSSVAATSIVKGEDYIISNPAGTNNSGGNWDTFGGVTLGGPNPASEGDRFTADDGNTGNAAGTILVPTSTFAQLGAANIVGDEEWIQRANLNNSTGTVTSSGTPEDGDIAVFTTATDIEGQTYEEANIAQLSQLNTVANQIAIAQVSSVDESFSLHVARFTPSARSIGLGQVTASSAGEVFNYEHRWSINNTGGSGTFANLGADIVFTPTVSAVDSSTNPIVTVELTDLPTSLGDFDESQTGTVTLPVNGEVYDIAIVFDAGLAGFEHITFSNLFLGLNHTSNISATREARQWVDDQIDSRPTFESRFSLFFGRNPGTTQSSNLTVDGSGRSTSYEIYITGTTSWFFFGDIRLDTDTTLSASAGAGGLELGLWSNNTNPLSTDEGVVAFNLIG